MGQRTVFLGGHPICLNRMTPQGYDSYIPTDQYLYIRILHFVILAVSLIPRPSSSFKYFLRIVGCAYELSLGGVYDLFPSNEMALFADTTFVSPSHFSENGLATFFFILKIDPFIDKKRIKM